VTFLSIRTGQLSGATSTAYRSPSCTVCSTVAVNGIRVASPVSASTRQNPPCAQIAMADPSGSQSYCVYTPWIAHASCMSRSRPSQSGHSSPVSRSRSHSSVACRSRRMKLSSPPSGLSRGVIAPPGPPVTRSVSPVTRSRRRTA
jgi:hypothetical protein